MESVVPAVGILANVLIADSLVVLAEGVGQSQAIVGTRGAYQNQHNQHSDAYVVL